MQRSEKIVRELMEKRRFDVILNDYSKEPGIPDFKCINFETGEKFYLEVKPINQQFTLNQIRKIKELLSKNQQVRVATVIENKVVISKIKSDFSLKKIETMKYVPGKLKDYYAQRCKICNHRWESRVPNPTACPRCKRYDWKETIKILAIVIFSLLFIPNLVQAATWNQTSTADFTNGTFINTTMSNGDVVLKYHELPNYKTDESSTTGMNMTGNVVLYHFNQTSNSTPAMDYSGNTNNGTWNNGANITINGKFANASLFDGINDYISNTSLSTTLSGDLTISFWLMTTTTPIDQDRIAELATAADIGLQPCMGPTGLILIDNSGGPTSGVSTTDRYDNGKWTHVAITRSGTTYALYVNGTLIGTTGGTAPTYTRLYIGGESAGIAIKYWKGNIDDFAVWNRNLSATEISTIYLSGAVYHPIGQFESQVYDAGENQTWQTLSWNETLPQGTDICGQVAVNNTGSWVYSGLSCTPPVTLSVANNRFIKANFTLNTTNMTNTPIFSDFNITYISASMAIINTNSTTAKRGNFLNITITSESTVTANITKPNGAVTWLTTPTSKGSNTYETNYTFTSSDPPGSYMIGANSSTNTNTTNVTMSSTIKITLESDKMSSDRKIITRSLKNIQIYGTATYADNSAYASKTLTFTYGTTTAGTNTTDASGNYNFTFQVTYDGNYTLTVTASDSSNNTGTNSSILTIRSRPEYVKYRMTFHINNSNANNVYRMGTASLTNQTMNNTNINNLQYASNLSHYYVCSYDNVDYTNGILLTMMHSYKGSYLDYINFSSTASNPNYTLEIRSKPEGSNLLLAYTKGTCELISSKIQLVESQAIPSNPLATFSFGTPSTYHYEIRALYDKIDINGTDTWTTGTTAVCVEKTAVSNQRPVVYVRRC